MTAQEIFDKAYAHSLTMTMKSASTENNRQCRYRADLTPSCELRCLIGSMIPDELYEPILDKPLSTDDVLLRHPYLVPTDMFPQVVTGFITELQGCHDWADAHDFPTDMNVRLRRFASERGLTIPGER